MIQSKEIQRLLLRVYRKYERGEVTEARALKEAQLLQSLLRTTDSLQEENKQINRVIRPVWNQDPEEK